MPPPPILEDRKWMTNRISRHFRSIFYFCSQNGCRQPFLMTENHFRSHFSPFQINTQLLFLFTKWPPAAILDDRKSVSIAFLAISDQYTTSFFFDFFSKWPLAAILEVPFGPFYFDRISLSNAFLAISDQYATLIFLIFSTKWLPAPILDDRKSLSIAFLAISDQYATFIFFHKMAAKGHFGWPKITFDRISRHFRSIRNFDFFFTKWLPAAILDDRKSLSNVFLAISDQYATFIFFSQNGCQRPFWMTENHFRMHFSPFQINTQLFFFLIIFSKWPPAVILEVPFGPFWMTENHFRSHFSPFQINTQLFFLNFFQNGRRPPFWKSLLGHFGWPKITFDRISRHFRSIHNHFESPICAKNNRVLPLCVINGYAKYEVDRWICDTVRDATSFLSIFIQNGRQRPFCFSDWWQKS